MSERGDILLGLARASIAEVFGGPHPVQPAGAPWLDTPAALFVTLHKDGDLRGCIGTLEARRSLFDEVVRTAKSAAFHDPRLEPLRPDELPEVVIDLAVLSPLERVEAASEAEAIARLRPGVDGVVLDSREGSAVFIPKMWKQLPEPHDFLLHLRRKAGLHGWPADLTVQRFTSEEYSEAAEGAAGGSAGPKPELAS